MSDLAHSLQESGIGIVGVGLIGGSIAASLKAGGFPGKIIGYGRSAQRLTAARSRGLIDDFGASPGEHADKISLVIVCTPVDYIVDDVKKFAALSASNTLITDAGSVKGSICSELDASKYPFVGSHPMAGSEKTGFEHAKDDLFVNRVCILTPTETTPRALTDRTQSFWKSLGMRIVRMSPEVHDRAVATTSHLPHVVAAALSISLPGEWNQLTAGGFRDSTRIAGGDPDLWDDILLHNSAEVRAALAQYRERLQQFDEALVAGDASALKKLLEQAKSNRDALLRET